jgi:O-antigen ligase
MSGAHAPEMRDVGATRERGDLLARLEEGALLLLALSMSLSIAATEIAFFLALVLRLTRAARGEPWRLKPVVLAWAGAALAAAWVAAGAASAEPIESLVRARRLYVLLVLFLVAEGVRAPRAARRLATAYLAGAVLGGVYGLGAWVVRLWSAGPHERLAGAFSTGMTAGNVLATALVAAVALMLERAPTPRLLAPAAALASAAGLAATRTRSSWLGALAGLAAAGLTGRRRGAALAVMAACVLLVATVPVLRARAASAFDPRDFTAQGRVSLWLTGWDLFRERPVLGWGLADQRHLIAMHRRDDATFLAGHFHNNVVQVAVMSGAVGLAAYVALMALLGWCAWRARRRSPWARAAVGVWLAFQVGGLFDWSFGDAEVTYHFLFWMGLGLADIMETEANPHPARLVDPSGGA